MTKIVIDLDDPRLLDISFGSINLLCTLGELEYDVFDHPSILENSYRDSATAFSTNNSALHILARSKNKNVQLKVLNHPSVGTLKGYWEVTPLHLLASSGLVEVLKHPDMDKIKDQSGETPLHYLASRSADVHEILSHPSCISVKNDAGYVPLYSCCCRFKIQVDEVKHLFPWADFGKYKYLRPPFLQKLLNTPQSLRFIMGNKP